MTKQKYVLTDVSQNIWEDQFSLSSENSPILSGSGDWSISKRTLQGGKSSGVDVIELNSGSFQLSILPTRGMGLWRGQYQGLSLGWESPVAQPVHPAFVNIEERNGLGWLGGFNELLCRCGLASNGAPGVDVVKDNNGNSVETRLTLHGKIANTPAHFVEVEISDAEGGRLSVTGVVDETMMFGPCLRLKSTVTMALGSNTVEINDEVTNLGGQPAEMQLLYHTNIGRPFLEEGAEFVAPISELAPRDTLAADALEEYNIYRAPQAGFVEQVYFISPTSDRNDRTTVMLHNATADRGVSLNYSCVQLPCLTLWKNTQAVADGYVTGIEPATNFPNLKTFEREQARVPVLQPGESRSAQLVLAVHATRADVDKVCRKIEDLQSISTLQRHKNPSRSFSPVD